MMSKIRRARLRFMVLMVALLGMTGRVVAQEDLPLIAVGQNQTGTLAGSAVRYRLSVDAPQSADIRVLAISTGLTPAFRVLDPSGAAEAAHPPELAPSRRLGSP